MPKYLTLPTGDSLEVPDSMSYDAAMAEAQKKFPQLFAPVQQPGSTGGASAFGAGLKSGLGSTAQGLGEFTGLSGLADYGKRLGESATKTYRPTSEADIEAAKAKGFLPEAGAYLSKYITEPVGEAVGNVVGRYGLPTLAGAGAAALAPEAAVAAPLLAEGATGSGLLNFLGANTARGALSAAGFAGANAPIHIGENVAAQKELGEKPSYLAAAAAGIAQTAVDSLAGAVFNAPLKGILGKTAQEQAVALAPQVLAGKLTAEEASKQVSGTLRNIAQGTAQNAVVGTGMMIGNEALTRAATGQSLTSPEAREAYAQNLKMGVGMSPLFGAMHGMGARGEAGAILQKAEAEGQEARAKAFQTKAQEEAEHPEYIQKVKNEYEDAWAQYTQMRDALGSSPGKDEPPHLALEYREKKDAVEAQKKVVDDLAPEYHRIQKILKSQQGETKLLGYIPTDIALPGISPRPEATPNVLNMVDEHNRMLEKQAEIQKKLSAATPEEYGDLHKAYEGLNYRLANSENAIKEAGGMLGEPEQFEALATKQVSALDKKIKSAETLFNKARDENVGDFSAANTHAQKLLALKQERQKLIDTHAQQRLQLEQQATGKGETLPMFSQKEAPPVVAKTAEEATSFLQPEAEEPVTKDKRQRALFHAQNYKDTALRNETVADRLAKAQPGETPSLFSEKEAPIPKQKEAPKAEPLTGKEGEVAPEADTRQLDLFTPENFERTEERNLPEPERQKRIRDRLDQHLLERLGLPGAEITRTASPKQVDYVMERIQMEKRKIEEPIGRQKISRIEEAKQAKERYDELKARYDAGERGQIARSMASALNKYNGIIAKYITPAHEKIENLHKSLYTVKKVASPKDEREAAREESDKQARRATISREAATARRINKGDVRKEAADSEQMRSLARELGRQDPAYISYLKEQQRRLKARVDAGHDKVAATNEMQKSLGAKAEKLGTAAPEYKAALKERTAYLREAFASATKTVGPQVIKSKRTTQVTRDVTNAPKEMRGATDKTSGDVTLYGEEARRQYLKEYMQELREASQGDEFGTEYRGEERTRLSEANQERLANKDLVGTLNDLAKNSEIPLIRESAARLSKLVGDTKIQIVSELKLDGVSVPALYNPKTNTIKFHPDGLTEEDLIHEAEHAATLKNLKAPNSELSKEQQNARNEIFAIYSKLKNTGVLEGEYGVKSPEEFVAEVRSNQALRDKLQGLDWFKGNMLQRLFMAFKRLIGIEPRDVLDAADSHIKALESQSSKVQAREEASIFRSSKAEYGSDNPLSSLTKKVIAQKPTLGEKIKDVSALVAETELVDMRAPIRQAANLGAAALNKPDVATQMISHVIRGDDKVQMAMSVLGKGSLKFFTDEKGIKGVESSDKDSGLDVFKAVSKIPEGNAQGKTDMATTYLIANRTFNKGLKKLDIGALGLNEKDLKDALDYVNSRPELKTALEDVRAKYNAYNEGQINFLAESGAIPKKMAAELVKEGDYVPFYRVDASGQAQLIFNDSVMINVGNIKNQPYLHALKGGETKILPLDQSMLQNTLLLTDKALTNLTNKSLAYGFQELGNARTDGGVNDMVIHRGQGPADKNVLRFNQEPDANDPNDKGARWIRINTTGTVMDGVPNALLMKSMEGTALSLPAYLEMAGSASDLLRSGVTRTPLYLSHQLLRDPIAAVATGGVNKNPLMAVLSAGKTFIQLQKGQSTVGAELLKKGIIHSNIFKGDSSDITKFALQLASGKDQGAIAKLVAWADKAALNADASTRVLVYQSAREKGLSQVEAEVAAREFINYQKRGLSASVQHTNRMVPFMSGQIQALNSFIKAARGNMPYNERLEIQKKFYNTALTLAGTGLAYGFAIADNPYYKNAKLQDKYGNLFVFLPGVEEPVKIPIPYEVGYFFSLGAAAADAINGTAETADQAKALAKLFSSSVPGYSSKGVPQIIKPIAEVALNTDFYTGNAIESDRLRRLDPEQRFTANTTELAKQMSHLTGGLVSPIMLEHITRGYLGQLPLAAASGAQSLFTDTGKGVGRASDLPFVGGAFQKLYGGEQTDEAFKLANDSEMAKATLNSLKKTGTPEEIRSYMEENKERLINARSSEQFKNKISKLSADIRYVQSRKDLSSDEKQRRLDQLDAIKQRASEQYLAHARH